MMVAWSWLKEYVDLDMSVEELVHRLMMAGLNHESTSDVAGDIAIDLEVTSNRPDCLGHLGIAREAAALFHRPLRIPSTAITESGAKIQDLVDVSIDVSGRDWCPQYRARVVEGIKIGPSPAWLARRLEAVGLTPINNVVDVTNYVLFECGQPLHAFDLDKLSGRKIIVRSAQEKESFLAINNKKYELKAGMGVIADRKSPVALAGVMGGKESEVGQRTTNVLIESAEFTPRAVRQASRSLDLSSDSSYRFERRIDPMGVAWASDRACHLIAEIAGGRVAKGVIHLGEPQLVATEIRLRHTRIGRILGMEIPLEECGRILESLGLCVIDKSDGELLVRPPSFRRDLIREIDLIEEIGRIHGYEEVSQDRMIPLSVAPVRKDRRVMERIRQVLVGSGFQEAVTFSFTDRHSTERACPWPSAEPIELLHSSRKHENCLRPSLVPSLLDAVRLNESRGNEGIRLFETASIYHHRPEGLPEEPRALGLVAMADIRVMRGVIESIFDRLGIRSALNPVDIRGFQSGQAAEYRLQDNRVGVLGVVSRAACESIDLRAPVVAAELLLEPLTRAACLDVLVKTVPDQPAISRDLAVVIDESTSWRQIEEVVLQATGSLLESHQFIDLYRGKQVEQGKKSIAFRMTFRAADRTLTHDEVDKVVANVVSSLDRNLSAKLRA